jgi:dihydrofolate reductase
MPSTRFIAVLAMDPNRVIGKDGGLPWHLPEDLKFFKKLTMGRPIIMGRSTFESIGRPLPGRRNIVLSRTLSQDDAPKGIEVVDSVEALSSLDLEGDNFVIGGAGVFSLLLPLCEEVVISHVFKEYPGDTFLPPFEDAFQPPQVIETFDDFEPRRYVRLP